MNGDKELRAAGLRRIVLLAVAVVPALVLTGAVQQDYGEVWLGLIATLAILLFE